MFHVEHLLTSTGSAQDYVKLLGLNDMGPRGRLLQHIPLTQYYAIPALAHNRLINKDNTAFSSKKQQKVRHVSTLAYYEYRGRASVSIKV